MDLWHTWSRIPFNLSATRKYSADEIWEMCKRKTGPFWLRVDNKLIPVSKEACLFFACQVSSAYHDWVAYNAPEDDGFAQDMAEREERIRLHMLEPDSDDSDSYAEDE